MSIRLNVIDRKGKKIAIEVEEGTSIKDAIEEKMSPDNFGNCGGNCICGTCHVYVNSNDFGKLPTPAEDEFSTLKEEASQLTEHSRLGCQIELKKDYNDITVTIAPE
tara:strand:+ start:546 stop:866 length:321 start_codon:yes stop_codon:yes gene_type:complete